ncbi:YgaP family membrane protein [Pedobacter anseongensis]|uniref:YgaP family membrane protein n=1 Tax=Pedobacter anseongensis TaxID=3133439 RepID=UPI003D705982
METNMAPLDRILRLMLALGLISSIYFIQGISSMIGIIMVVIAGILCISSIFGFCLIYALIDFKTSK